MNQAERVKWPGQGAKLVSWLIAVAVLAGLAALSDGRLKLATSILLVICVSMAQLLRLRRDPLDAPALYTASSVFLFAVMALYWLRAPAGPPPGVDRDDISEALVLVAIGLLCLTAGALVAGPPRVRPVVAGSGEEIRPPWVLVGVFAVGLLASIVGLATQTTGYAAAYAGGSGVSAAGEPIILLSWLAPLSFLCAVVIRLHRPRYVSWLLVTVLAFTQVIVGIVAGFKGQAILPIEYFLLAYLGTARSVPWRHIVGAAVIFCVAILPLVNGIRDQQREGYATVPATVRAMTDLSSLRPDNALRESEGYFSIRLRHIDQIALIKDATPSQYPFAGGATYTPALIFQALPRALWPEKPVLDQATQYAHTYWQVPEEYSTATPLTQFGDLYRNFGLSGLLGGAAFVGLILGLYQRAASKRTTLRFEVIHIFVLGSFVAFMKIETELPVLIGAIAKTLPIGLFVALLIFPPRMRDVGVWLAGHKLVGISCTVVALIAIAVGAYDGPLSKRLPPPQPDGVVSAFQAQGAKCAEQPPKPAPTAALWNLRQAFDCRFRREPVLLLIFDTRRATVQARGAAEASASGLLTAENVVAIYDPERLTSRGVKQLRYTLQAAIRKSRSHPA